MIDLNKKPKIAEDIIVRQEDFGGLAYNPRNITITEFNNIGLVILKMCNGKNSISQIIRQISDAWKKDEKEVKNDVINFIGNIESRGLIKWV